MEPGEVYCTLRINVFSRQVTGYGEVLDVIGPPVVGENGHLEITLSPLVHDKTARCIGTFTVTGPVFPPLPKGMHGGEATLDSYLKRLESLGCKVHGGQE